MYSAGLALTTSLGILPAKYIGEYAFVFNIPLAVGSVPFRILVYFIQSVAKLSVRGAVGSVSRESSSPVPLNG